MDAVGQLSDPQLIVALARCDEVALAEVYRRHGGAVFGLDHRVTGDEPEAEDVTQEVFVRLWRAPERFAASRGTLRAFLLVQAHGRAVDAVRSRAARQSREQREAKEAATAPYDLEREIWDLAVADQVAHALAALPDDERRVIEMAYFDGHTYREVASLLDQPEGTVKSRIRHGLHRMRQVLSDSELREP